MTQDVDWLVKNYASFFKKFGIDKTTLAGHYEAWKTQSNEGTVKAYLWYLFHVLLGETKKQVTNRSDYHRNLHDIYIAMLEFTVGVEGRNGNPIILAIIRNRIQQWQTEITYPFRLQAISLNCCSYCEQFNGQEFSPEEVLQKPHFASDQCTKKDGCSCGYMPVTTGQAQTPGS